MRGIFFVFYLSLFITSCTNKVKTSDDIIIEKINALLDSSLDNSYSLSKKINFCNLAYDELQNIQNDSLRNQYAIITSFNFYDLKDYQSYFRILNETKSNSKRINDTTNLIRAYGYIGEYFHDKFQNDSAYYYYYNAQKLALARNNNLSASRVILMKAHTQQNERDFLGAENSVYLALKLNLENNNPNILYEANRLLGIINVELNEFSKAFEYYNKAQNIVENQESEIVFYPYAKNRINVNIAEAYFKLKDYNKTIYYIDKNAKSQDDLKVYMPMTYALGVELKTYSEYLTQKISAQEALQQLNQVLRLRKSYNFYPGQISSKIKIAEIQHNLGNVDSSFTIMEEAHQLAKNQNILNSQISILEKKAELFKINPSELLKEASILKDSLIKLERLSTEKFARIEFETDEFKKEAEKLAIRNQYLTISAVLMLLIFMLMYVVYYVRAKAERLAFERQLIDSNQQVYHALLEGNKELEERLTNEKQRIAREIHDGVLGRMFGIRYQLDMLNHEISEDSIEQREHYIQSLKELENDLRGITHDLNTEEIRIVDQFMTIFTNLIEEQRNLGIQDEIVFQVSPRIKWNSINEDVKINLYRITQECLQNINKYAQASKVLVLVEDTEKDLILKVEDNGVGFDLKKAGKGIGMKNINFRVQSIGGYVKINSEKDNGSKILVSLPKIPPKIYKPQL
ncbi:MAG: ATP-binding protein [Flavobacterium sp.]